MDRVVRVSGCLRTMRACGVRVAGVGVLETSCPNLFFNGVRGEAGVTGWVHAAGASNSFD
jgi:hypothetical protein